MFIFFTLYFQKQNKILKYIKKTITNMIKAIIIKNNNNNKLLPKVIFAMIYINNNYLIKVLLSNIILYKK